MPTIPSIQSLVGAHSGGVSIGLDWPNVRAFELSSTNLSRYGLLTGAEEAYTPLANLGGAGVDGVDAYIAVAPSGDLWISATGSLFNGAAMFLRGDTLALDTLSNYPSPKFGLGGMFGLTYGSSQYAMDLGLGGFGFNVLNELSEQHWLTSQNFAHDGGVGCAGPAGTGVAYILSAVNSGGVQTGPATLSVIQFDGAGYVSNNSVDDIAMSDIDAGWSDGFRPTGMCLDQTDGNILAVFVGSGNSNKAYLAKIDPSDASIVWKSVIPGSNAVSAGPILSHSSIQHQRIGFFTVSPATATIFDTSDGSIDSQFTNGLQGIYDLNGQCYSDTLGAIVIGCSFSDGADTPTKLNSTPSAWVQGFAVLYVAAASVPTPGNGNRRWLASIRSMKAA